MSKVKDMVGKTFGRLTVIAPASRPQNSKSKHQFWLCKCDCGKEKVVNGKSLRNGHSTSCGCKQKERAKETRTKHGMSKTRLYNIYKKLKRRCYNTKEEYYNIYGGRGILVHDEWLGENGFKTFVEWSLKNGYADNLSIDRIDVNGNYGPNNCRWVDFSIQNFNQRPRNNKTGHTGVYKQPNGKYKASITKNKKHIHLGYYDTLEEAVEVRERAEKELYPECSK